MHRHAPAPRLTALLVAATAATAAAVAAAGTYNPDRSIGDVVPAWEALPGTDGRDHGWADVADKTAVVVVFTCNSCPYAVDLEGRLNALARRYAAADAPVAVVAINSNRIPEDAPEAMRRRALEQEFAFPYLFDESQEVAKAFGAVRTPECFVIDGDRRIVYMGAFDDAPDGRNVGRRHVDEAVAALLAGVAVEVAETPPVGCQIRFARRRNPR